MIPWLLTTAGCPLFFSPHPPAFPCTTSADCAARHLCDATKGLCVPTGTEAPDREPDPSPDDAGPEPDPSPDDAGPEPDPPPDDGGPEPDPPPDDGGTPPDGGAPTCTDDWDDASYAWRLPVTVLGPAAGEVVRLTLDDEHAERLLATSAGDPDDVHVFMAGVERDRIVARFGRERVQLDVLIPGGLPEPFVVQLYTGGQSAPLADPRAIYPLFEDFESLAEGTPDPALGVGTPSGRWSIVDEQGERFLRVDGASRQAFELAGATLEAGTLRARMRFQDLTTNHSGLMLGASSFEPDNLDTYVGQLLASEQTTAIKRYEQGTHSVVETLSVGPSPDVALVSGRWYTLRAVKRVDGGLVFWVDGVRRHIIPSITPADDRIGLFGYSAIVDFDDVQVRPFPAVTPTLTPGALERRCDDTPGFCGDGVIDADLGEVCDDGDLVPGDGCDATCAIDVIVPAPVARWRLDSGGATAADSAGAADGAADGTWLGYDEERRFRHFDGDDRITLGQPASLDIEGEMTIVAWMRTDGGPGLVNMVSRGHRFAPNHGTHLRLYDGELQGGYWDGEDHLASTPLGDDELGRWLHVAVTYLGGEWRLFVDGALRDSSAGLAAPVFDAEWAIGRRGAPDVDGDPRFFGGDLADVRIYDQGLSDAAIAALAAGAD